MGYLLNQTGYDIGDLTCPHCNKECEMDGHTSDYMGSKYQGNDEATCPYCDELIEISGLFRNGNSGRGYVWEVILHSPERVEAEREERRTKTLYGYANSRYNCQKTDENLASKLAALQAYEQAQERLWELKRKDNP
jgi:hypothetical protein